MTQDAIFPRGLYAITDPYLLPSETLISAVESALKGGAKLIQYRDKNATEIELVKNAQNLQALCIDYQASFIVNDDVNLSLRVKAHGVHLGKSDGDIISARKKLGADKILGVTCHNDLNYAQHCIDQGVSYCAFGRIFPSKTKQNAPHCDIKILKLAAQLTRPSVAIGGITLDNLDQLIAMNIHTVAVIHGLFAQHDIEATARKFSSLLNKPSFS